MTHEAPATKSRASSGAAPKSPATVSPGMLQYLDIKAQYTDYLLCYRMGDFYELFFDDARRAARILDIALTRRGELHGEPIAMCGVPYHSAEPYLERLIQAGAKVAICEQLETPEAAKKRGHKAVVARDVVRILTPGTLTEETLLTPNMPNYLAALAGADAQARPEAGETGEAWALAWADISTGECCVTALSCDALATELGRLNPAELLLEAEAAAQPDLQEALGPWQAVLVTMPEEPAGAEPYEQALAHTFPSHQGTGFESFTGPQRRACGMLCRYIKLTQKQSTPRLDPPQRQSRQGGMQLDAATQRNLELTRTLAGKRAGSLLHVMDATVTAAGGRLLAHYLTRPLADARRITQRLDAVAWCLDDPGRGEVRELLASCPDMERIIGRLHAGRGGPRDMASLRTGLYVATKLYQRFHPAGRHDDPLPPVLADAAVRLGDYAALHHRLQQALVSDPPLLAREGGFIANGYHAGLDEQRRLRDESLRVIATTQRRYAEETGIASLKIKHNQVLGYYIEVSRRHEASVPERFIHRQTIKDALRYNTTELAELEQRLNGAHEAALKQELELYEGLLAAILAECEAVVTSARALAELDVLMALAELAARRGYVRPDVDDTRELDIEGGRHPVVEFYHSRDHNAGPFIRNDCRLEATQPLWLLTGPNMAGKSTFLRQNALIALMAQMGSFVPAARARIGVVDALFSRVGASDDLARGQSTFMVEMVETAAILHQASARSLVILDEVGRGTATYDGLAIAWAVVEYLHHQTRCRCLFATHYHELTTLAELLPGLACYTMRVKEWDGEVVLLHEVVAGTADRSYGIHVAKRAGLPASVLARARGLLQTLEHADHQPARSLMAEETALFAGAAAASAAPAPASAPELDGAAPAADHPALQALGDCEPDSLTPKAALELLYRLRDML